MGRDPTDAPSTFANVRSKDLIVGELYRLRIGSQAIVRVLETPPEMTSRATVRVQFESGVKKGEISVVPSVRILEPVRPELAPDPPAHRHRPRLVAPSREPDVGDDVTWAPSGALQWHVQAIDRNGAARIRTELFEQDTVRTVPLAELRVAPLEPRETGGTPLLSLLSEEQVTPVEQTVQRVPDSPPTSDADVSGPRRPVDAFLDDLLFTAECLAFYRRRFAPTVPSRSVAEHLRDELREHGHLVRVRPANEEYIRIRVAGRFDVVLPERPEYGQTLTVRSLRLPKRSRQRRAPAGRRRAA